MKYPHLVKTMSDSVVEDAKAAADESLSAFKEWLLTQCHAYAIDILSEYHKSTLIHQNYIGRQLSNLEFFDKLIGERQENPVEPTEEEA